MPKRKRKNLDNAQPKSNWFARASMNAAMADNPSYMQAIGWEQDRQGNYHQNPKSKGAQELSKSLYEIGLNGAVDVFGGPILEKGLKLIGKGVSKGYKAIKNSSKYQKYIKRANEKSTSISSTITPEEAVTQPEVRQFVNTQQESANQYLPTYDELYDELDNWRQANLNSASEIRRPHVGHSSYNDVANVANENFYRKLNRISELGSESMNVEYHNPRTMSDEEYLRGIEEARDLYQRWQTNPESFQVPVRDNITSVRPTQSVRSTSLRPSLSEVEPVNIPSRPSINTSINTQTPIQQSTSQRTVHTINPIPESSPVAKTHTAEDINNLRKEVLDAEDAYALAVDDGVLTNSELFNLELDASRKNRLFKDAATSYLEDIINNVDVTKPANEAVDLNSVPDYLVDYLEKGLRDKAIAVNPNNYLHFNYDLSRMVESRKTLPSGYRTYGRTNHPNFISQEGVGEIKKELNYYKNKASDSRNFGTFTEEFNNNFSLQSKPMITGSLTELSKARKASGSLPVKVQFTKHGRTQGNRMADLIIPDETGNFKRVGTQSKKGPTEIETVLKSNIKRELEMYKEFGDQLGVDRSTIDDLFAKFRSGEMSTDDFAKIKTKDGYYMFTTFDKKNRVPRYPSLRFDFKLGGSLNNRRSLKHGGIYIKPSHRGRFTALKERTGHSTTWFKEHGTPAQKKMATFALNAAKWNH